MLFAPVRSARTCGSPAARGQASAGPVVSALSASTTSSRLGTDGLLARREVNCHAGRTGSFTEAATSNRTWCCGKPPQDESSWHSPGDGQVVEFAFSPDGRLLATTGRSGTIRMWDAWTGSEVGRFIGHRGELRSLSFSPDGRALASGGADSTVLIWDVSVLLPSPPTGGEKLAARG